MSLECLWTNFEMYLTCLWHVVEMSLTCLWNVFELSLTCIWRVFDMSLNGLWLVSELYLKCLRHIFESCLWIVFEMSLKCLWHVFELSLSHLQVFDTQSYGYCLVGTQTLTSVGHRRYVLISSHMTCVWCVISTCANVTKDLGCAYKFCEPILHMHYMHCLLEHTYCDHKEIWC